jgi:two-component system cell cycle response regulator/two-component system alkaline phosphatase synthesis response regulator PhoP/putative two-component system response regulator
MEYRFYLKNKKAKILIIDDEEDVCVYLKSILERTGKFEVFATTSPIEGIELAKTRHPDLILLDIMMPEMDGTYVAEQLHNKSSTRDILIVFVTVLAKQKDVEESGGLIGGHPFIAKPIQKEELVARIESLLQEHAAAR